MDAKLRELQRLAKTGDAEDKARYLAVLTQLGRVSRRAVQLAAMFVEAPEAKLLEPDDYNRDYNRLGEDADLYSKVFKVAQEASYAGFSISEFCRQSLLWIAAEGPYSGQPHPISANIGSSLRKELEKNNRAFVQDESSVHALDNLLSWEVGLVMRWVFQTITLNEIIDFSQTFRSFSYHFHIAPQLLTNFMLYGSIEGP